jgi:sRNA-binding carbon storage regulator CsrA
MLVPTRKPGQAVLIQPSTDLPAGTTIEEVFGEGGILVVVKRIDRGYISMGIQASQALRIDRLERIVQPVEG